MRKYIDSEAFFKLINTTLPYGELDYPDKVVYNAAISDMCGMLTHFPAADVQEVKHGHWEKVDDNPYEYVAVCSVCRNEVKQPTCMLKPIYSYCPICGARMVNEDA